MTYLTLHPHLPLHTFPVLGMSLTLCPNQVAQLPLSVSDGRWHHICITWTTRDGFWEAYQDGERLGTGDNLAPWHPIKPGGVIILGQEQVRAEGKLRQLRKSVCANTCACVCFGSQYIFPQELSAGGEGSKGRGGREALLTLSGPFQYYLIHLHLYALGSWISRFFEWLHGSSMYILSKHIVG